MKRVVRPPPATRAPHPSHKARCVSDTHVFESRNLRLRRSSSDRPPVEVASWLTFGNYPKKVVEVALDPQFLQSTLALEPGDAQRIWKAVERYTNDPNIPSLNLERLQGGAGRGRLWSIRASQKLRVLLARQGSTSVLLRAGYHDEIYELADRAAFVAPLEGSPGLIEIRPTKTELEGPPVQNEPVRMPRLPDADEPSILRHWRSSELTEAGFDEDAVNILRNATVDTLLDVWPDIDDASFNLVLELSELSPNKWRQRRLVEEDSQADERFRRAIVERGALAGLSSVLKPHEIRRLAAAPIEDWMIFLHPDQRALVDRRFNGPARVRGSAGTGKTVVALHRAAALAKRRTEVRPKRGAPILFTTFVKSLPPVLENLYARLPTSVLGAVEFINIDKLARRVCVKAGHTPNVTPRIVDSTFAKAFRDVVKRGSPLERASLTRAYLRDEVTAVIKGRGINSLDEYLEIRRTGRRVPFSASMRQQAWTLRMDWDQRLADSGVVDFPDIVRMARDIAREQPTPRYEAAIVDESQDLTLVGLQLVMALIQGSFEHDQPDGLFIVGDGAQKVYPGGYTLSQAGINIQGNSTVLRLNYRNPRSVIETAMACAGSELVDDLGEEYARGDVDFEANRDGARPQLVKARNSEAQIEFVAKRIRRLEEADSITRGDIGVFAATNSRVKDALAFLTNSGMGCQELTEFNGQPNQLTKLGTFHRSKGLEFKVVFLLDLSAGSFPSSRRAGQSEIEYSEQKALQLSQLFVAMTRARDSLYVLYSNEPSDVLYEALDCFDIRETDECRVRD